MSTHPKPRGPGGRPAAASAADVIEAATRRYGAGERIDLRALSAELGVGRSTIHRWFGTRDDLIATVLLRTAAPIFARARQEAGGHGAQAIAATLATYNRALTDDEALRRFLEQERETGLRIITDAAGRIHPRTVAAFRGLIEQEVANGYRPPVPAEKLAYALTRLGEAFLFTDALSPGGTDTESLSQVQAALLGA